MSIFQRNLPQVVDYYQQNNGYRRILEYRDELHLIEVKCTKEYSDINSPEIQISLLLPKNEKISDGILDMIWWILGLDYDLEQFYRQLDECPDVWALKEILYGLRPIRSLNIYEALVIAISEQQISLKAALSIRERLARKYSKHLTYENVEYFAFPSPSVLASAKEEDLRSLGFSKNKIDAIKTIANLEVTGELAHIFSQPIRDIFGEMTKIKGIGHWTIEYALCRGMGRYEAILTKDLALTKAMKNYYGEEKIQSDKDIKLLLSRFGEHSGYAAFYFISSYIYDKNVPRFSPGAMKTTSEILSGDYPQV